MRLASLHRRLLIVVFAGTALSGLVWGGIDLVHGLGPSTDLAIQLAKTWLGRTHGAFAMAGLAVLGSLLAVHMPAGWKSGLHRLSGGMLLATALLLAVTGYLLYYASDEALRTWSAYAHIAGGVAACAAFAWHRA